MGKVRAPKQQQPNGVKLADDLKTMEKLKVYLCADAISKGGKVPRGRVDVDACRQCESQCAYGRKYIRLWKEKQEAAQVTATKATAARDDAAVKKLEADKAKAEKRLRDAEASWQASVEHAGELEKQLEKAKAENEDLRETVAALVKEKAVLLAKLKEANQTDAELERVLKELDYEKAERRKQRGVLNALKARLWDMEHPNAEEI